MSLFSLSRVVHWVRRALRLCTSRRQGLIVVTGVGESARCFLAPPTFAFVSMWSKVNKVNFPDCDRHNRKSGICTHITFALPPYSSEFTASVCGGELLVVLKLLVMGLLCGLCA